MSLGEAVVEVGADASGFGADLSREVDKAAQKANRSLSQIGKGIDKTGQKLTLGLSLPIAGIGVAAVKSQASFEQSMNLLGVNADIAGAELEKMSGLAKQLGADTVFSAGEAADAMLELAKSGFKPAQIAGGGVQATMALAATEGLALADAATITGNAMNAFGIKAKDASAIADALAGASAASSASVESLSQALAQVGPGAKNAGLTLQDTVGVLAAFDQAGIKGSDAGTSLKTMLARLVPQTKKAREAMAKYNLEFVNADGSFKNITEIAGQLQDRLGGLSEAQRVAALNTIFGSDATRAASVLIDEGTKGIGKYVEATKDQGKAQELADARMKGTAGALERMSGSVDTAAIALGTALAPTVVKVAGKVEDLANWFSNLDEGTQQTIATVGALVAAAGPLLIITGKLVTAYGAVSTALSGFSFASKDAATGVTKFSTAARLAAGAGGLALMYDSTNRTSDAMGALQGAAGGALSGAALGAFAGPQGAAVGAAIGGLVGGAQALVRGTTDAGDAASNAIGDWEDYAATLDQVSGATTELTRKTALQKAGNAGILKTTRELGIADRQVVNAIVNGGKARDNVIAAIERERGSVDRSIAAKKRELDANLALANDMSIPLAQQTAAANAVKANREEIDSLQNLAAAREKDIDNVLAGVGAVRKGIVETQEAAAAIVDLTGKLQGIPAEKRTAIKAEGIIPTTKGILDLTNKYNLTPKQVRTIVAATGVPFTEKQITGVINKAKEFDRQRPKPNVDVNTGPANAALDALVAKLQGIVNRQWTTQVNALFGGGADGRASGGRVQAGVPYVVGERRAELFIPGEDGYIAPRVPPLPTAQTAAVSSSTDQSRTAQLTIINPIPQTIEESAPRALANLAFVMGGS